MKHLIFYLFLLFNLFFLININSNAETVEDLVEALNDIKEEINSLPSSDSKEAKIIDQSLEEINKVANFALEKIESKDLETAKSALAYTDKSLGDVGKVIPKEFESDMSNADIENFAPEKMETLKEITTAMNSKKKENKNLLLDQIIELNDVGFNTSEISGRLASLGIDTVTMIELDNRKFDKIKDEIVDNQLEISKKQENIKLLEDKLDPLENQIQSLESQKQAITDKYNANLALQTTQGKKLTEQYNKDIEKISQQITQSQSEANNINSKIDNINSDIDSDLKNINDLTKNVSDFNNQLQENSTLTSSKQVELNNLKSSLPKLDKQMDDLNSQKKSLTLKYEEELARQAKLSLTPEELEKSKNLTKQINDEIGNVSNQINQMETQTSDLSTKISSLSKEIEQNNLATNELSQRVESFNLELQKNSTLATSKQTQLTKLQSSLPILENQINDLNSKKNDLTNKYNEELAKQATLNISAADLRKSKELSDKINKDINNVSTKINQIETESVNLNGKINNIKNEINSTIADANQLNQKVVGLKDELQQSSSLISAKKSELNNLQSLLGSKDSRIDQLNKEIADTKLQRDFAQTVFEKNINKEIEALQTYGRALVGEGQNLTANDVKFALKEVEVLLDPDPRKQRAFEFEMYGTYAGLSQAEINKGIDAAINNDWETQKSVLKNIYNGLAKNPNWSVDPISEAQINVMIAEEKAINEITWIAYQGEKIKNEVNKIIADRSKPYQQYAGLNTTNLALAVPYSGSIEEKLIEEETIKILNNNSTLQSLKDELSEKQNLLEAAKNESKKIMSEYEDVLQKRQIISLEISNVQKEINNIAKQKENYIKSINPADPTYLGGLASLNRDKGNSNYSEWTKNINSFDQKIGELNALNVSKNTEYWNKVSEEQIILTQKRVTPDETSVLFEVQNLGGKVIQEEYKVNQQARQNVIALVEDSKIKLENIKNEEIGKAEGYNYQDEVYKVMEKVPTWGKSAKDRVNQALTGITSRFANNPDSSLTSNKAAALKAALYGDDGQTFEAYKEVTKASLELGKKQTFSGVYWEMSHVKMAAILKSKKYDHIDDYAYIDAFYKDKINLTTDEKKLFQNEYSRLFPSQELIKVENKITLLNEQFNKIKSQAVTSPDKLNELKNEIAAAEKSKKQLETQIINFDKELEKKVVQVKSGVKTLNDLEQKLNPLNSQIASLKNEKTNLTSKLNDQIAKTTKDIETKAKFDAEATAIKDQYDKEMQSLTAKIDGYQSESKAVTQSIETINVELKGINSKNTELQNQITSINGQINQNQLNINTKQASLNSLQEQLAPLKGQLNSLKSNKTDLSAKLNNQIEAIAKEMKEKGKVTLEAAALKKKYEAELSQLATKISSIESQSKSTTESINLLNSEIGKFKENEIKLKGQISSLNDKISINQKNIDNKKSSLNSFKEQLTKSNNEIQKLNDGKKGLSVKLEEQAAKVAKELESTGEISAENLALKQAYETQLAALNQKIKTFEVEAKSINSSMEAINLELNKLEEIQKITATKAKLLVPDAAISVKFNYENTSISKEASRVGAISLGKSEAEWASSWKGNIATTKIVDGNVVNLSDDEIQSVKANLAMESTMQALATGQISKDLAIDASELNLATSLSASIMVETLQRQSKYLSYAVKEGMHEMTTESAMKGVKSLGKSEAEWAAAWTGGDPTHKNVNGVRIDLTPEEIQATKAEWAMNRAAQSIMEGKNFTDGSLTIDANDIQQATATATKEAMADVQQKAANIANQVASTAQAVQEMQQGISAEVGQEVAASITEVVAANESLAANVAERAIDSVEELEDYLNVSTEALTNDTSSWTDAQWAASWTGDEPGNDPGLGRDYTQAEKDAIKAEWAKNRAKQYGK